MGGGGGGGRKSEAIQYPRPTGSTAPPSLILLYSCSRHSLSRPFLPDPSHCHAPHSVQVLLDGIKFLVLDEADRMLDMGFEPEIRKVSHAHIRNEHDQ